MTCSVSAAAYIKDLQPALAAANARADAAEANERIAIRNLSSVAARRDEDLAAARRECDLLRALLVEADASLATWHDDAPADECDDCVSLRPRIRVALTVSEAKT